MKELKEVFRENVIERKNKLKWTQQDLESRSGVSNSTISYIELGGSRSDTKLSNVEKIAKAFKVEAWQMLIDDKAKKNDDFKSKPENLPPEVLRSILVSAHKNVQSAYEEVKKIENSC